MLFLAKNTLVYTKVSGMFYCPNLIEVIPLIRTMSSSQYWTFILEII